MSALFVVDDTFAPCVTVTTAAVAPLATAAVAPLAAAAAVDGPAEAAAAVVTAWVVTAADCAIDEADVLLSWLRATDAIYAGQNDSRALKNMNMHLSHCDKILEYGSVGINYQTVYLHLEVNERRRI